MIPDSRFQIPDSRLLIRTGHALKALVNLPSVDFQIIHDVFIFKGVHEPCLPLHRPARWQACSLHSVSRFQKWRWRPPRYLEWC